jgi:ATP-dependent DNA helicase RecQ
VVNLGAPQSPVAYYQQVGRAGRGTDNATVVLLPQQEDKDIWAYFASLAFPREDQVRHTLRVLAEEGVASVGTLETRVDLGRTRLEQMLKVLDVDGAVRRVRGGWEATGQEWTYDAERYERVALARKREQRAMLDYLDSDRCRMWFLRDQLDDPEVEASTRCGRCDTCGGLELSIAVSDGAVDEARTRLARPGVVVEPRAMWPTALVNLGLALKGRIGDGAEPGRAVARLTDLGHGQALRELFAEPATDADVPEGLVRAVIEVLHDWLPSVDGLVVVESARRPTLTGGLADGLSRFLKKPVVARWAIADPSVEPGQGAMNSAQRVAAVTRRFRLEGEVPAGPVLLVDDQVATGWTLTLAARALREAGATEVLPLVLATRT